jgi:hypothetical protein
VFAPAWFAATAALAAPDRPDFAVVYEGATHGLTGAHAEPAWDAAVAAALQTQPGAWRRAASGLGAFLDEGRWLLLPQGGVRTFAAHVAASPIPAPGEPVPVEALVSDAQIVLAWPPEAAQPLLDALERAAAADPLRPPPRRTSLRARVLRGVGSEDSGEELLLLGPPQDGLALELPMDASTWEPRMRTVFQGSTRNGAPAFVYAVARVGGEGSRRLALVRAWRDAPSVYVSAGDAVERALPQEGGSGAQRRALTWDAWHELGLHALAPQASELSVGVAALQREADGAAVALLSANLARGDGSLVFEPYRVLDSGGRRVALIGWTDPAALAQLPPDLRTELRARGRDAVLDALARLAAEPLGRPDLVLLFGIGAREVAGQLPGVDLVIGDFSARLLVPRSEEVSEAALRARSLEDPRARAAALLTRLGPAMLGRVDVAFDGGVLRLLRHVAARLDDESPRDEAWIRRVQRVRQAEWQAQEDLLVPGLQTLPIRRLRGVPPPAGELDAATFARLCANLLMDRTGADVALLPPLAEAVHVPGETRMHFVSAALSVPDDVVVADLSGAELRQNLARIRPAANEPLRDGAWAWAAGVQQQGGQLRVRGRTIQDGDLVRLATTDRFESAPDLADIWKKPRFFKYFRGSAWRRPPVARPGRGSPWALRDLVLEGLIRLRDGDPTYSAAYARALHPLLLDHGSIRSRRLTLELDGLSVQLLGSLPVGDRAGYEASREGRVQQQRSFSATLRGRVALLWEDRAGSLQLFTQAALGRMRLPGIDEPVELEDDFLLGGEARLLFASVPLPRGSAPLAAFLQPVFDTEFTPQKDAQGAALPRQRLLRGTAGATLGKYLFWKEFRAGAFVEYDLAATMGPLSPGLALGAATEGLWGPIRQSNLLDLKAYLPTAADGGDDLGLLLLLRSELSVAPLRRVIPGLSVGAFVDALVFRGKRASNEHPGMHLLLGATLTYDSDLRPPMRLRL